MSIAVFAIRRSARPLLRSAVKSGIMLMEAARATLAVTGETLEGMVAESRGEIAGHDNGSAVDANPPAGRSDTV